MAAQSFCGARRTRAPLAPPRLSEPRNEDAEAQAVETSSATESPEARTFAFSDAMSFSSTSGWLACRKRVLPDQLFLWHLGAKVARARAHVAVGELEPRSREGVGELVRVLQEAPRDLLVRRVKAQRQVGSEHRRCKLLRLVVRMRDGAGASAAFRHPLMRARGALRELPFEAEQVPEEVVAPPGRRGSPGHLESARDRVRANARAVPVVPAEALRLDIARFRLRADVGRGGRAVRLAERVAAGDERHRLFVVHRHAAERVADVLRRRDRVGIAVRALRVHVDEAHLHRAERVLQVARMLHLAVVVLHEHAVALDDPGRAPRVADVAAQPFGLAAPVDVLVGLPHVGASAAEAEGLEPHRLEGDVPAEDHQVSPGDLAAVLLLDGPKQASRLVEAYVVGPAIERSEALLSAPAAASPVADAVGAGAVPGHADEEGAVVPEVRGPPRLGICHQRREVLLQRRVVQALEFLRVVEVRAHRVGFRGMLVEQVEAELVGPPVTVRDAHTARVVEGTLHVVWHVFLASPLGSISLCPARGRVKLIGSMRSIAEPNDLSS